ncbi:hydroxyisourate hydrolase [Herbiconiux sp. CPCC 205716]|uniref:5-hydroxyisourate hydrolase n=1 Tax=Herbiconiux gentiana TaxID=2970912 RepID=A0ABT2GGM7_9MICO|nr:hydroxyisourate hydrolase [Herbiconiux gentiana]MCS5715372.1 hydroxyisourate hydrolase [Herbiconiux gentiana]
MTDRSHVTTHVLDSVIGRPAAGVPVVLEHHDGAAWVTIGSASTDEDGRVNSLGPVALEPGRYRVGFDTATYFAEQEVKAFYPEVQITFELADAAAHYHVPLLLSPFAFSTYRGS